MRYESLNPEREAAYLENSQRCPFCQSGRLEGDGDTDYDGDLIFKNISCRNCGRQWHDEYRLSGAGESSQECFECGEFFVEGDEYILQDHDLFHTDCLRHEV